ncbi:MAG TPA: alkaline phosphatase family protein [Methylocella sp.]|nr:alkaline phosphatase family protein [Methylocella sp.]
MRTIRTGGLKDRLLACVAAGALACNAFAPLAASAGERTKTPIKHVITIIGENRSFDHVFATYKPVNKGESVLNLLSKKIVKDDGSPGPNYGSAVQYKAYDLKNYNISPPATPYSVLPPALTGGTWTPYVCQSLGYKQDTVTSCKTLANIESSKQFENGLAEDYYQYLLTGGTGQLNKVPDNRINYDNHDASHLPPGPYQLTSKSYPYDAYAASPVHRFYQMRQQLDCNAAVADLSNGWGCSSDLYAWVEVTIGAGSNGAAPPSPFTDESTGEGSTALGFYNVQHGDAPYFKELADTYSMSDNYHQAVAGGTGANHIMMGTGDAIWFSDGNGNPQTPPNYGVNPKNPGTPLPGNTSALSEIENPNPQPGTNNYYTQDGYGGGSGSPTATAPSANYGGGSYVGCADSSQPGVPTVLNYLKALQHPVDSRCDQGYYYLVNNYNPGYFGDGTRADTDTNSSNTVYTIPPSSVRTIGDVLVDKGISWAYYGDEWNEYVQNPYAYQPGSEYCNICNFEQYATSIMTNSAYRTTYLKDTADLYSAIQSGDLPAVSFVKPSGLVDGHPSSSKLILFEGFVKKIVDAVKANPSLWADTAIFITFDEGGGYWDSGYVQPLDFFGDGTRIPMIAVSKYTKGGHISHTYTDHVSVAKFIEANWGLPPITGRSRDNLPNPTKGPNPYIPGNSPAIGDLMDFFHWDSE